MPILQTLATLLETLGQLAVQLLQLGFQWGLLLFWIAWWLWGVNWNKAWPALRQGAWAPLVLIMVVAAFVWSRIVPADCVCQVPNFLWQLGAVGLLAGVALLCGWVQGHFGWAPAEINLDPPVSSHDDQGHGHGHH